MQQMMFGKFKKAFEEAPESYLTGFLESKRSNAQ